MSASDLIQSERQFTVDFLSSLGKEQWLAASLCRGWTVEDVAAHLIVRERNPLGGIGIVIPRLESLQEGAMKKPEGRGHKYIIQKLSKIPWYFRSAGFNVGEFYVHNEDMLRGELRKTRPNPSAEMEKHLWRDLKTLIRFRKDQVAGLGTLELHNQLTGEQYRLVSKIDSNTTVVSGKPSELILYFYGRRNAAKVEVENNGK